jgi:FAD/FMN-containing dehydrogenase
MLLQLAPATRPTQNHHSRSDVVIPAAAPRGSQIVNDVHSGLNPTRVHGVAAPASLGELAGLVRRADAEDRALCVAGARHAMGAQQFATDALLVDTRNLNRVLHLDADAGTVEVESGVLWPQLIEHLNRDPANAAARWGIIQKQTGADRLSIGGALSANVHGRGLRLKPFINDVESFTMLDAAGRPLTCSRRQNPELFRLAVGGYGLFGVVYSVTLRLTRRRKLRRVVREITVDELMPAFGERIADGFLFGDFQFATDPDSPDFLRRGVFPCYMPVDDDTPVPDGQKVLSDGEWRELLYLAHADKSRAYRAYAGHYLATSGQVYWSDEHQLTPYLDGYHEELDRRLGSPHRCSEMITELYVPRDSLPAFLSACRADFLAHGVNVIYGTVRLIERDDESFLAWAKQQSACVIFNLHVEHTPAGISHAADAFRRLIDLAAGMGGSYYLTYHRFAKRRQVLACYPQFPEFLRLKDRYDPRGRFQSDWYRHHKTMFAD